MTRPLTSARGCGSGMPRSRCCRGDSVDWTSRRKAVLDECGGISDAGTKARALWFLAFAEAGINDVDDTERLLAQTLDIFDRTGDQWGTAAALATRAKLAQARANTVALERDGKRSAELFRLLGDRWGLLQATEWLAGLAEMTGDHEQATRLCREVLHLAEELELWPAVSRYLCWLGWIALELGDYTQARKLCEQAARLATQQNSPAQHGLRRTRAGLLRPAGRVTRHRRDPPAQPDHVRHPSHRRFTRDIPRHGADRTRVSSPSCAETRTRRSEPPCQRPAPRLIHPRRTNRRDYWIE
ncbi:tetratricopeptide repeat protein [Kibdelosporangium aridum]|uniref:tetratricopeptide repeat protein n=1 Tax=Kibdelosporangium aridum TaxID=2030 RepID=UPI00117ABAA7